MFFGKHVFYPDGNPPERTTTRIPHLFILQNCVATELLNLEEIIKIFNTGQKLIMKKMFFQTLNAVVIRQS